MYVSPRPSWFIFRCYFSSRLLGFHLVKSQKTKSNEMEKKSQNKKKSSQKNSKMKIIKIIRKRPPCITSSDTFIFLVTGILISLIDKILCFVKQKTHRFVYYLFCQTLTVISEMLFLSVKHLGRLHNKLIN